MSLTQQHVEEGRVKGEEGKAKRDLPERSFLFALRIVELCQVLDEKPGVSRTLLLEGFYTFSLSFLNFTFQSYFFNIHHSNGVR